MSWQLAALARPGFADTSSDSADVRTQPLSRSLTSATRTFSSADVAVTRASASGRTIVLTVGVPLTVVDGGSPQSLRTPRGASVAEALDIAGVRLGPLDQVVAREDGAVASGDVIRVIRIAESDTTVEEAIPFAVTTVADDSLIVGRSFVVTSGVPGLARDTYHVRWVDGAEADRTLIASSQLRAPVAEVRHVGVRPPPVPSEIESLIRSAAATWGADADQLLRVAWCESRYNPSAYNASSGTSGLFQFMPGTWAINSVRAGYAGVSVFDPAANANVAAFMFANHQSGQWACK